MDGDSSLDHPAEDQAGPGVGRKPKRGVAPVHRNYAPAFGLPPDQVERVLRARTTMSDAQIQIFLSEYAKGQRVIAHYARKTGAQALTVRRYFEWLAAAALLGVDEVCDGYVSNELAGKCTHKDFDPQTDPDALAMGQVLERGANPPKATDRDKQEQIRRLRRLDKTALLDILDDDIRDRTLAAKDRHTAARLKADMEGYKAPEVKVTINIEQVLGPEGINGLDKALAQRFRLIASHREEIPEFWRAIQGAIAPPIEEAVEAFEEVDDD